MVAPSIQLRTSACLGIIALFSFHPTLLRARSKPHATSDSSASQTLACGCPDGRRFAIGASVFGKNSARVVITGFRPDAPVNAGTEAPRTCRDLAVLGQVVHSRRSADDRPYFKREDLKRGTIPDVCHTRIHFAEVRKTYDFFADDGTAVTLTDEETGQPALEPDSNLSAGPALEIEPSEDLTGKDLLQLMLPQDSAGLMDDPADSAFDEQDMKEGAYFVLGAGLKVPLIGDRETDGAAVDHTFGKRKKQMVRVFAGTLGKIEQRAGFRSEPRWIVEILPNSAPQPFWRSLVSFPGGLREHQTLPSRVILSSNQMVEINHFFDRYGVESTLFGRDPREVDDTTRLPEIYSPRALPLAENLAAAESGRMLEAIQQRALGLVLVAKDPGILSRRETLVLEESDRGDSPVEIAPHLLRRQCFLGLNRLEKIEDLQSPALQVTGIDVKVFRPQNSAQVPLSYYAIDLELLLKPNFSSAVVPLVCRFPSLSVDTAMVGMAERILSSRFEIRRGR